jgi:predicted negative regulator of RcsB-dependent stress response
MPAPLPLFLLLLAACAGAPETDEDTASQLLRLERLHRQWEDGGGPEAQAEAEDIAAQATDPRVAERAGLLVLQILLAQGETDEAARRMRRLPEGTGDPRLQELRASLLLRLGRYREALSALDQVEPGDEDARRRHAQLRLLAEGLIAWSEGRVADAEAAWRRIEAGTATPVCRPSP